MFFTVLFSVRYFSSLIIIMYPQEKTTRWKSWMSLLAKSQIKSFGFPDGEIMGHADQLTTTILRQKEEVTLVSCVLDQWIDLPGGRKKRGFIISNGFDSFRINEVWSLRGIRTCGSFKPDVDNRVPDLHIWYFFRFLAGDAWWKLLYLAESSASFYNYLSRTSQVFKHSIDPASDIVLFACT